MLSREGGGLLETLNDQDVVVINDVLIREHLEVGGAFLETFLIVSEFEDSCDNSFSDVTRQTLADGELLRCVRALQAELSVVLRSLGDGLSEVLVEYGVLGSP